MFLEGLTIVVALWCAEHNVENCPKVYVNDLAVHDVRLQGIYGHEKNGQALIIIDDDVAKDRGERWEAFYHEFAHFMQEAKGKSGHAHGIGHRRDEYHARMYVRKNHTGGWN